MQSILLVEWNDMAKERVYVTHETFVPANKKALAEKMTLAAFAA